MHKLSDENGIPVNCASGGSCGSCHAHSGNTGLANLPVPENAQQMAAVLAYLEKQNQQMEAWLSRYVSILMDLDFDEAAMHLQKAAEEYARGNLYLSLAHSLVKEE